MNRRAAGLAGAALPASTDAGVVSLDGVMSTEAGVTASSLGAGSRPSSSAYSDITLCLLLLR